MNLKATLAALMTLGLCLVLAEGSQGSEDLFYNVVAILLFGLLPLVLGPFSFFRGIRRLNQTDQLFSR